MSYSNIPVANAIDVIKQIATIGAANGWTIEKNTTRATDSSFQHIVMRYTTGGPYFHLIANAEEIHINMSRGYSSGADWDAQPDQAKTTGANYARVGLRTLPIVGVHVFASATPTPYIFVAIEKQPGYYRHVTMGQLDTFGNTTGGGFVSVGQSDFTTFYGSFPQYTNIPLVHTTTNSAHPYSGVIDVHVSPTKKIWAFPQDSVKTVEQYEGGHSGEEMGNMISRSPNAFNSRTILQAPFVSVFDYEGVHVPYGTHNALRYVDMTYYNAGDEITIGSDVWKVFPIIRKGGISDTQKSEPQHEGSGDYGIAYLKV